MRLINDLLGDQQLKQLEPHVKIWTLAPHFLDADFPGNYDASRTLAVMADEIQLRIVTPVGHETSDAKWSDPNGGVAVVNPEGTGPVSNR